MNSSSSIEVFVWVNASDLMQFLPNLVKYIEPDTFKDVHIQAGLDKCCVMCKMVNSIELYKFQPRFINGKLFIICPDVKILNISNGFIPEYMFVHSSQIISHPKYNPFVEKAPNPYNLQQLSSSYPIVKALTYDDTVKKEEARKKREARCMQLKAICEDKSTILSGLIHMAYMKCIQYYGSDAVYKAPGAIYCDINDCIIRCGKFMNQEIKNIIAIVSIIDENTKYQYLITSCELMITMWDDIETWYAGFHKDPSKKFNELTPKIYNYIDYFQDFALNYNRTKINNEPLSAIGLINMFIEKDTKA